MTTLWVHRRCRLGSLIAVMFLSNSIFVSMPASKAHAEISEGDAWNVGSVFAAGSQCEMKGYMTQGQTTPLIALFFQRGPAIDGQRFRDGYQEGLKRTAIYSKNFGRWVPYPLTAEGCSQVQYAITQYKIAFDSIGSKPTGTEKLTGTDRSDFIASAVSSCMREYGKGDAGLIPQPLFDQYCRCYANGVADRLSIRELRDEDPKVNPKSREEAKRCYQAIKDEAMRTRK